MKLSSWLGGMFVKSMLAACIFATSVAAVIPAVAQGYPNRAIKIVVPATAGGALDLISRVLADKTSEDLKQPVYVENKPGANWIIGMQAVASAAPDGYTLLVVSGSGFSINPHLFKNVPPISDFTPIIAATKGTFVLIVNPKLNVATVPEFINVLKQSPGKLNHASNSATTKLLAELFKVNAGVEFSDIGYRGASQSINDTMLGITDFSFVDYGSASSFMQQGVVKPLAVTSLGQYELSPEIKPLSAQGFPGFAVDGGTIVFAPAQVPREIIARLNQILLKVLKSPDTNTRFRAIGQIAFGNSAEETEKNLMNEARQWADLIRDRNIKFNP